MIIKAITSIDSEWTKVIDYAEKCSWKAGINLANAMRKEQFTEWERVFIAIENDEIAGYCTVAKTDCIPMYRTLHILVLCLLERNLEATG